MCDGAGLGELSRVGEAAGVGEAGDAVGRALGPALGLALGDACVPVGIGSAIAGDDGEVGEALAWGTPLKVAIGCADAVGALAAGTPPPPLHAVIATRARPRKKLRKVTGCPP